GESLVLLHADGTPVSVDGIVIADLRDILDGGGNVIGWNHEDKDLKGKIAIDPERGRVLLAAAANAPLSATFHYGSVQEIGGGEYERTPPGDDHPNQQTVANAAALQPELDAVRSGGRLLIGDSLTYAQTPTFRVDGAAADAPDIEVVVAAHDSARPLINAAGH